MPRLPSVETLGKRPVPSPVPAVSRVDAGAATGAFAAPYAALAEQGREIMGIGDGVYQINEHLTRARRASELSEAMAGATEALGRTEIEFQKDQDFLTSPQRFVQRAGEIGKGIEDGLSDDIVKQSFRTEYRKLAAAKHLNVLQGAAKQEGDARVSQLDSALDLYATVATGTQNPAERNAVLNQARIALEEARSGGWISDVEAGKRARAFGQRLDQAMVLRDMTADPGTTAARLALDPSYGSQIDPVGRERLIDQGLNRAESQRQRQEAELRRQEKEAGDKALADAWTLFADGRLTRSAVDAIKYKVSPSEYHQLLAALKKGGGDKEDNRATFGRIQWLLSTEAYDEALSEAFAAHSVGRIKDGTLSSIVAQAQSRERRTGPKSPYETNRSFLASQLKPGPMSMDPAPEARMGQALMEYDDWIRSREKSPPTDTELRSKTLEIAKKWSMIDMDAMVRNTGAGTRGSPSKTLEDVELRAKQLEKQFKDKSITQAEYNRRMADLKNLKDSAERAERTQGER